MHVTTRITCVVGLVIALIFRTSAARAETETVLEKMTSPEIAHAIQHGSRTVIIPIGGTEQSGPFIAVGKHNIRVKALAKQIAERLGHTLVAPVIAYVPEGGTSPRTSHMRFPGTISIPPQIFEGVLTGVAESLRVQGFERIAVISDHGGYRAEVAIVVRRLNKAWHGTARIINVTEYYDALRHKFAPLLRQRGFAKDIGQHADIMDTSLTLAIDPMMVRRDLMKTSPRPTISDGVYGGDPRRSTEALGTLGASMQVDAAIARLRDDHR